MSTPQQHGNHPRNGASASPLRLGPSACIRAAISDTRTSTVVLTSQHEALFRFSFQPMSSHCCKRSSHSAPNPNAVPSAKAAQQPRHILAGCEAICDSAPCTSTSGCLFPLLAARNPLGNQGQDLRSSLVDVRSLPQVNQGAINPGLTATLSDFDLLSQRPRPRRRSASHPTEIGLNEAPDSLAVRL